MAKFKDSTILIPQNNCQMPPFLLVVPRFTSLQSTLKGRKTYKQYFVYFDETIKILISNW